MTLSPVLDKLQKLADTPSTNNKITLLKKYLEDPVFLKVVKFALSGDMKYGIQKLPSGIAGLTMERPDIFDTLKRLSLKSGATDADKYELSKAASIDKKTFEVVQRIINKDLKCGVDAKTVNKARKGTVNIVPYMRCSTDKKIGNIRYPAVVQEKADGVFVNVMINSKGQIKIITRNGKTVYQLNKLKKIILSGRGLPPKRTEKSKKELTTYYGIMSREKERHNFLGKVYNGELLVRKNGKVLDRKTGNGIINQCMQKTAKQKDANCVILRVWDCLPLKNFYDGYYDRVYNDRLFETNRFVRAVNDPEFVDTVMSKRVESYKEAYDFYGQIRDAGGEGAILKNLHTIWKDHTSTDQVKMKNVSEAELEIVGWASGKEGSKYEMCMGAIHCKSACGKLRVSVGSGFSDSQRELDWDMAIGEIVTVAYESVIQDKRDPKKSSLFLPRFKDVREDRDTADTLKEILER